MVGVSWGTCFILYAASILLAESSFWDLAELLSLPALVLLNGLFVAAEFALVSVRKTRVEEMVRQGVKSAKKLEGALAHLDRAIAATQLGITLASIGLGWVGEPALVHVVEPLFRFLERDWQVVASH